VPLAATTIAFAISQTATFGVWYAFEKTFSIYSIDTSRRELFYWLAILVTFALGTAASDFAAEALKLGYMTALLIVAGMIALVTVVYYLVRTASGDAKRGEPTNSVVAFWLAYILARPLGASIGDYMSENQSAGGLGIGTTATSAMFLTAILAVVIFLTVTKKDAPASAL